jgi:hypothetical protein
MRNLQTGVVNLANKATTNVRITRQVAADTGHFRLALVTRHSRARLLCLKRANTGSAALTGALPDTSLPQSIQVCFHLVRALDVEETFLRKINRECWLDRQEVLECRLRR